PGHGSASFIIESDGPICRIDGPNLAAAAVAVERRTLHMKLNDMLLIDGKSHVDVGSSRQFIQIPAPAVNGDESGRGQSKGLPGHVGAGLVIERDRLVGGTDPFNHAAATIAQVRPLGTDEAGRLLIRSKTEIDKRPDWHRRQITMLTV